MNELIKVEMNVEESKMKHMNGNGVYLIRNNDTNELKIGITNNLSRRFSGLKSSFRHVGYDDDLCVLLYIYSSGCDVLDNRKFEKYLHTKFADFRKNGEWFDIKDDDVVIKEMISSYTNFVIDNSGNLNKTTKELELYIESNGYKFTLNNKRTMIKHSDSNEIDIAVGYLDVKEYLDMAYIPLNIKLINDLLNINNKLFLVDEDRIVWFTLDNIITLIKQLYNKDMIKDSFIDNLIQDIREEHYENMVCEKYNRNLI